MEEKKIRTENHLGQEQVFLIEEYDNYVLLKRFLSLEVESVRIPDTLNGKPVTVIGDDCFFGDMNLQEIFIPNTIEIIGIQAFGMCRSLEEVIMPDSVREMGHHAFRDCKSLRKVVLSRNLKCIPWGAFAFCYLHEPEFIVPEGVESIEGNAFWSGGSFELMLPKSTKSIAVGAFYSGPNPVTELPYDPGWFSQWPYGETVLIGDEKGKITGVSSIENNCAIYEVTTDTGVKQYMYPCDFTNGAFSFEKESNQSRSWKDYVSFWDTDEKKEEACKTKTAWEKGILTAK